MTFWEFWGLETPEQLAEHKRDLDERMRRALADYKQATGHDWTPGEA